MPVLVLVGDIYPALGGNYPGNFATSSTQALAANVTGITVPLSNIKGCGTQSYRCTTSYTVFVG
jgi:hypothetical protein